MNRGQPGDASLLPSRPAAASLGKRRGRDETKGPIPGSFTPSWSTCRESRLAVHLNHGALEVHPNALPAHGIVRPPLA